MNSSQVNLPSPPSAALAFGNTSISLSRDSQAKNLIFAHKGEFFKGRGSELTFPQLFADRSTDGLCIPMILLHSNDIRARTEHIPGEIPAPSISSYDAWRSSCERITNHTSFNHHPRYISSPSSPSSAFISIDFGKCRCDTERDDSDGFGRSRVR